MNDMSLNIFMIERQEKAIDQTSYFATAGARDCSLFDTDILKPT